MDNATAIFIALLDIRKLLIHQSGEPREAGVGLQSADTIKLNFRFRCPRALCTRLRVRDQTTKVLAIYVVERENRCQGRGRQNSN
jgi:hypothetical protein